MDEWINGNSSAAANTPIRPASWYPGNLYKPWGSSLTKREGRALAVKQEFRSNVYLGEYAAQLTGALTSWRKVIMGMSW